MSRSGCSKQLVRIRQQATRPVDIIYNDRRHAYSFSVTGIHGCVLSAGSIIRSYVIKSETDKTNHSPMMTTVIIAVIDHCPLCML